MPEQITFIHTADLHLDSPFIGLSHIPEHIFKKVKDSTFDALSQLVQAAVSRNVDFVLITGDLFDNEKQNLKAQIRLKRAFEELHRHQINVYLSYGNHDFINGNVHPVEFPENVFVFPDENVTSFTFEKNGQKMASIYGFSYENRAVTENKTSEYQPSEIHNLFHIAMLHGSLSSNTEHDVYAPFQLGDLTEKDYDYWALGHIHKREILKENPAVVYPGNIQGRNRKESGAKGCYHVELTSSGATLTFVPLQSIQFNELNVDVADCINPHHLEQKIQQEISSISTHIPQLLHLNLKNSFAEVSRWNNDGYLQDMLELINESLAHQANWKMIYRYKIEQTDFVNDQQLAEGHHFAGELIRHIDGSDIQSHLSELYRNRLARKYMSPLNDDDENEIKQRAKQLLIDELLQHGGE
ncbi:metallophosphoesterase family protein [Virgibacillus ihumii]|uniref:metallophosphoesterase family protein n=1 Tax=Virgibacillus ihumii TaxID=2686091 RepID=UPI00157C094F|nr:DNA repair exonuclease [Virgibacillus ihumii]